MSNFWKQVEEGAEPLEPDKVEARNASLLAEIQLENAKLEVKCELDLEAFVVEQRCSTSTQVKQSSQLWRKKSTRVQRMT